MKKNLLTIAAFLAIIVIAGISLFKIFTNKSQEDGKAITESDSEQTPTEVGQKTQEGSQEA